MSPAHLARPMRAIFKPPDPAAVPRVAQVAALNRFAALLFSGAARRDQAASKTLAPALKLAAVRASSASSTSLILVFACVAEVRRVICSFARACVPCLGARRVLVKTVHTIVRSRVATHAESPRAALFAHALLLPRVPSTLVPFSCALLFRRAPSAGESTASDTQVATALVACEGAPCCVRDCAVRRRLFGWWTFTLALCPDAPLSICVRCRKR